MCPLECPDTSLTSWSNLRDHNKTVANVQSRHPALCVAGLGLTDDQLTKVVCAFWDGRARSTSQASGHSELAPSDTLLKQLALTYDPLVTEGNVPAGAPVYSDDQLEQIQHVYQRAVANAQARHPRHPC